MARRPAKKKPRSSNPQSRVRPGGTSWPWLGALLLLGAGGMFAWVFLRAQTSETASADGEPPMAAAVVRTAEPNVVVKPVSVPRVDFAEPTSYPRRPRNWLEAQVALSRAGFSCGSIDGVGGAQTLAAWHAFQSREGLAETNWLDPRTCDALPLAGPALGRHLVTAGDLARLQPLSPTWLGKSQQSALDYENLLELVAEKSRANPKLLRQLNPEIDWDQVRAGTVVTVPEAARVARPVKAAALHVQLEAHTLDAYDDDGRLIARFPVSIARKVEKRPVGELHVTVVIPDPNYTFDPDVFPESAEGRELGRRLVVPPGPNNPVGVAWVGLDRTGYGIHGTPQPEQVGRTESHGCFRLANWDARTLTELAWVGLPVFIDP